MKDIVVSARSNLFVPAAPEAASGVPLFCFPYAGGSPYLFMDWAARLRPALQVVAVQTPGHGARFAERPHGSVEEIVSEVVTNFPCMGDRPFAFYGHSLGAVIALEVARRLRRAGMPQPCHLFVGGARPPHFGPIEPLIHGLSEKEFLDGVQSRYAGIPPAVLNEPELLAILLPALRADFTAYETYVHRPETPLMCPISAFAGADDPLVKEEMMAAWSRYTSSEFHLEVLPGDHFFLRESGEKLTRAIQSRLSVLSAIDATKTDAAHYRERTAWQ